MLNLIDVGVRKMHAPSHLSIDLREPRNLGIMHHGRVSQCELVGRHRYDDGLQQR